MIPERDGNQTDIYCVMHGFELFYLALWNEIYEGDELCLLRDARYTGAHEVVKSRRVKPNRLGQLSYSAKLQSGTRDPVCAGAAAPSQIDRILFQPGKDVF